MFVFCPKKLVQNVTNWRKYLPSINPYYAVKCNPHHKVIHELGKLNINFECAAVSEIKQCFPYDKDIIYGHPHKTKNQINKAKYYGVKKLVYDTAIQLKLIHENYPDSLPILRIQSCEEKSQIKFNQKFGASHESSELSEIFDYHNKNNFNLYGISFHVGSNCYYPEQYVQTLDKIQTLINKYQLKINMIDIGGGFPGNFTEEQFKNHVSVIENYLKKHPSLQKYNFVGEPGRYIVDNTMTLKLKVINKKIKNNIRIYYINDGLYGALNCVIFDGRQISIENIDKSIIQYPSILYGQTCDSLDKIECMLPEYNINDTISIENIGAYSWASASSFNGFEPAKIYYK